MHKNINTRKSLILAKCKSKDSSESCAKKSTNIDMQGDFMNILPSEICLHILIHLDVASLCRAQQVCVRWYQYISACSSIWEHHCTIYKNIMPSLTEHKLLNSPIIWKAKLEKMFRTDSVTRRWLAGEFSWPKSYDSLPGDHIQELPVEVWGTILENELTRKSQALHNREQ